MDVWITWNRKVATCHYCDKPITVATPMVKAKWWRKKSGSAAKWSYRMYWHPQCWLDEALQYLKQHPYVPRSTGRPKLQLSEEVRQARAKLIRQRARLVYQLKETVENGSGAKTEHILNKLLELCMKIEPLGGIPKSWLGDTDETKLE